MNREERWPWCQGLKVVVVFVEAGLDGVPRRQKSWLRFARAQRVSQSQCKHGRNEGQHQLAGYRWGAELGTKASEQPLGYNTG